LRSSFAGTIFVRSGNERLTAVVVVAMYTTQNYPSDPRVPQLVRLDFRRFLSRVLGR
jgi:hypothetical protein